MFYVSDHRVYSSAEHLVCDGKDPKKCEQFSDYFDAERYAQCNERPLRQSASVFVAGTGDSACIFETREQAEQFSHQVVPFASQNEAQMFQFALALDEENKSAHGAVLGTDTDEKLISQTPTPISSQQSTEPALARRRRIHANIDTALSEWTPCARMKEPLQFAETAKKEDAPSTVKMEDVASPVTDSEKIVVPPDVFEDKLKRENLLDSFRSSRCSDNSASPSPVVSSRFLSQKKEKLERLRKPLKPEQADIVPDEYQDAAFKAAIEGKSFFLTGSAGTGKSFVLKRIIKALREHGKKVAVTASTGCAAVGIRGATIHSTSGVGTGMDPIETLTKKAKGNFLLQKRFRDMDTLIIDEISMIDSFLFDKIEATISVIRKYANRVRGSSKDGGSAKKRRHTDYGTASVFPFGGLQVIVCGDFFQLPPVGASDYRYRDSQEKFFAFEANAWRKTIKKTFLLRVVHRQAERKFAGLLNEIRQGIVTDCTSKVLNATRISSVKDHIEVDENGRRIHFTKLYAYRAQVSAENLMQLRKLRSRGVTYRARDSISAGDKGSMSKGTILSMLKNLSVADTVDLKQGSRVLCLKNLDVYNGIMNGSAGVVIGYSLCQEQLVKKRAQERGPKLNQDNIRELDFQDIAPDDVREDEVYSLEDAITAKWIEEREKTSGGFISADAASADIVPVVKFDNGVVRRMGAEKWDIWGMDGSIVACRMQVPLTLGWALSIHKAQGMTLESVETDLGRSFDYGQVYVALSRATSIHGLRLKSFERERVEAHPKVVEFYESQLEQQQAAKCS